MPSPTQPHGFILRVCVCITLNVPCAPVLLPAVCPSCSVMLHHVNTDDVRSHSNLLTG